MGARISLRMIAETAGVSVGTVSQALRNDSNTSRATCGRIQEIARKLGYHPDPVLASLAAKRFHRTKALSQSPVIFATNHRAGTGAVFYFGNEARARLERLGYAFRHENIGSFEMLQQAARRWYHQGVRGVIFGSFERADWIPAVTWEHFSVVSVGGRQWEPRTHTVCVEVAIGAKIVLQQALAVPSAKIGVVLHTHAPAVHDDLLREGVIRTFMHGPHGPRFVPLHFESFQTPFGEQYRPIQKWYREHRPDIVIGFHLAYGALIQGGELAGKLPPIYLFRVEDDMPGCLEPDREIAERGVEWLDAMIRHGERGIPEHPVIIAVPPQWHPGSGPP